jgi:hypothetical protein
MLHSPGSRRDAVRIGELPDEIKGVTIGPNWRSKLQMLMRLTPYNTLFRAEKADISPENTYLWKTKPK